jgi:hypothetical protein
MDWENPDDPDEEIVRLELHQKSYIEYSTYPYPTMRIQTIWLPDYFGAEPRYQNLETALVPAVFTDWHEERDVTDDAHHGEDVPSQSYGEDTTSPSLVPLTRLQPQDASHVLPSSATVQVPPFYIVLPEVSSTQMFSQTSQRPTTQSLTPPPRYGLTRSPEVMGLNEILSDSDVRTTTTALPQTPARHHPDVYSTEESLRTLLPVELSNGDESDELTRRTVQ